MIDLLVMAADEAAFQAFLVERGLATIEGDPAEFRPMAGLNLTPYQGGALTTRPETKVAEIALTKRETGKLTIGRPAKGGGRGATLRVGDRIVGRFGSDVPTAGARFEETEEAGGLTLKAGDTVELWDPPRRAAGVCYMLRLAGAALALDLEEDAEAIAADLEADGVTEEEARAAAAADGWYRSKLVRALRQGGSRDDADGLPRLKRDGASVWVMPYQGTIAEQQARGIAPQVWL